MKIHELEIESAKNRKRVGRGISSGQGKTAGRGTKGQKARTGGSVRVGFAGGQNPLAKILPYKRGLGMHVVNPVTYHVVNLGDLDRFKDGSVVDNTALAKAGLVKKSDVRVKILARGELTKKLTVKVQAVSGAAKAAIEKNGGTIEISPLLGIGGRKPKTVGDAIAASKTAPATEKTE